MTNESKAPNGNLNTRILVVDDHPGTSKTLALALSKLGKGVDVISATSGYEALELIAGGHIDILITDLMMPGMSGLELFEQMQSYPGGRPAYTFLVTAYDVPGLKETAKRLKINEIVIKPFNPERIVQMVADALDKMNQSAAPVPQGELTMFKILVADDQPDNIALLARYMKAEGYNYVTASDGVETLERARVEIPDLILLDVNMPKMDGFEVLRELRADPAIQHIPVIIFTAARLHPEDVQSGLNIGADDYVTKPFDRHELFARIRAKLRVKKVEDDLRRRNKELNILPEIGKDLSARLDINELSEFVLRRMVETLGAMMGHIFILNARSPLHKEYRVSGYSGPELKLPPLNDLLEKMRESRESIIVTDTSVDPYWKVDEDDQSFSVIVVPMFGRFDLIGLFVLIHERKNYFTTEHQVLLQAIASQASIAVENAKLYMEVAQEQERLVAVLESAADAILMFDDDGCLSLLNRAAEKLFAGYEAKLGLPLARGRGYDVLIDSLESAFDGGKSLTVEITWTDQRIFNTLLTPLDGGGCVVLLHDISHFKALERVKNEFIATASHDLRNPLTSIKGYSQLMQSMGPLNENQLDFVKRIHNASEHMTELVENMLDLAKMDLGAETQYETLDASSILRELADEFKPQAEGKEQTLILEKTEASSLVRGEALHLRQALRNLVGNAIKYTPEGGNVTLSSENKSGMVHIRIQDTGYGIPASDLPHIFERFYRVRNNGHDEIQGNGLGLAIVKSTIEQHGGQVTATSQKGEGTCFTVSLPLSLEAAEFAAENRHREAVAH